MTQNLIETRSLTKLYGLVIGVNDVTITVPTGVRGLLGPNGSGKSTLLKLIMGQLRPSEGEVRVFGEVPWNRPDLFRRVGFCPEQDAFYPFLTAFEFVTLLARLGGFDRAEAQRRAEQALQRVGAVEFMHRKIATYSKGMRQRTKMAQALVHDPEFLIFDEPLNGLDPRGRREITDLMIDLGRQGKSILVSSHVLHEVEAVTQEFLLMSGGRVLASGNVHEIRGLMNEYPHRITIRCRQGRALAARMVQDLPVSGLEIADDALSVLTREPGTFYAGIPAVLAASGAQITEMISADDNFDAVFRYLVTRD